LGFFGIFLGSKIGHPLNLGASRGGGSDPLPPFWVGGRGSPPPSSWGFFFGSHKTLSPPPQGFVGPLGVAIAALGTFRDRRVVGKVHAAAGGFFKGRKIGILRKYIRQCAETPPWILGDLHPKGRAGARGRVLAEASRSQKPRPGGCMSCLTDKAAPNHDHVQGLSLG